MTNFNEDISNHLFFHDVIGYIFCDKYSSQHDLISTMRSQELFDLLSHQMDWDGQIMSFGITMGNVNVASLLGVMRNSVPWMVMLHKYQGNILLVHLVK